MIEEEHYRKTSETIAKFKNGEKRYRTSVLFNIAVQMLVRGEDPFEVIDQLITATEDTNKALIQYMYRDTRPIVSMSESKTNHDE